MFWRLLHHVAGLGQPWHPDPAPVVDVTTPTVRALIARALWNERRERGGHVAWTYARDRVVERRELRCESAFQQFQRYARAQADKGVTETRMVV